MAAVQLEYHMVDLAELVRSSCAPFRDLAAERKLSFQVHAQRKTVVPCDGEQVEHVVLNLLFNAFKQAPSGGTIDVELTCGEIDGMAVISVRNDGPSLGRDAEESLFVASSAGGQCFVVADWLGFDLAIARAIMQEHGGSLDLVGIPPGGGVEFCAQLPLGERTAADIPANAWAPSSLVARRVARAATEELHVEDRVGAAGPIASACPQVLVIGGETPDNRAIGLALSKECRVAFAGDDANAISWALWLRPSLVIVDLTRVATDGDRLVARIRSKPELHSTPVLALISGDDPERAVALLEAGVKDVVRTPYFMPELMARVRNLLEAKGARDVLGALVGQHEADLVNLAADVTRHQRRLEAVLEELRAARAATETASRIKSNFLRIMSHELKTPVTSLVLQLELLGLDGLGDASSAAERGFKSMSRSILRLLHIVDTMLEWARVESGRFRVFRSEVDLIDVTRRAVEECRLIAAGKQIRIEVEATRTTHLAQQDPRLVELVLINLLERAIAVSDERASILVGISERGDGHVVSVRDGGAPLTASERTELFAPLQPHIDVARGGGTGSGLGLAVTRDLARAVGGELRFADDETHGSAIELSL